MNVFHKVTLASLKKNPVRTTVTIIGIMLSAAMICAVTTSVSSLRNFALENQWDAAFKCFFKAAKMGNAEAMAQGTNWR